MLEKFNNLVPQVVIKKKVWQFYRAQAVSKRVQCDLVVFVLKYMIFVGYSINFW